LSWSCHPWEGEGWLHSHKGWEELPFFMMGPPEMMGSNFTSHAPLHMGQCGVSQLTALEAFGLDPKLVIPGPGLLTPPMLFGCGNSCSCYMHHQLYGMCMFKCGADVCITFYGVPLQVCHYGPYAGEWGAAPLKSGMGVLSLHQSEMSGLEMVGSLGAM
jgi:hypothetical protein